MKLCNNCNAQLEDNAVFCNSCGVAQSVQPGSEPVGSPHYQQPSEQTVYNGNPNTPIVPALYNDSPVMAAVRKVASSSMFLVMAIAFSVSLVFSFIGSFVGVREMMLALTTFFENELYGSAASDLTDFYNEISLSGVGGVSIFNILTVVSLWMIFASAKDRSSKMNTSGLKILKVMSIIQLVLICVLAGLIVLLFVLVGIIIAVSGEEIMSEAIYDSGYAIDGSAAVASTAAWAIIIIALFAIVAVFAFLIIYQAFVVKAVNSAKKTVETETPVVKGFGFVSVMCIISGVTNLASSLGYVTRPITLLTYASSGLAILFAGLLLSRLKKEMAPFIIPPYMQYYQPAVEASTAPLQYGAQQEPVYQPAQDVAEAPVEESVAEPSTAEPAPVEEQPTAENNDEL